MKKFIAAIAFIFCLSLFGTTSFASSLSQVSAMFSRTQLNQMANQEVAPEAPRVSLSGLILTKVTAGATGDGPADQAECDRWAQNINTSLARAKNQALMGNHEEAALCQEDAFEYDEAAQDRGCFIVY